MLTPDHSDADREAKVDKIILFLTKFDGYIDRTLLDLIKTKADKAFENELFKDMRGQYLVYWGDKFDTDCKAIIKGESYIYPTGSNV
jgi:hypothetical protein